MAGVVLVTGRRDLGALVGVLARAADLPLDVVDPRTAAGAGHRSDGRRPGGPGRPLSDDDLLAACGTDDLVVVDAADSTARQLRIALLLTTERREVLVLHPRRDTVVAVLGEVPVGAGPGTRWRWLPSDFPVLTFLDLLRAHAVRVSALAEAADLSPLTPREHAVAALAARGLSDVRIAEELEVSPATVKTYVARSKDKLGVTTRDDLRQVYRRAHALHPEQHADPPSSAPGPASAVSAPGPGAGAPP